VSGFKLFDFVGSDWKPMPGFRIREAALRAGPPAVHLTSQTSALSRFDGVGEGEGGGVTELAA
jgi:hypothetical protein